MEVASAKTGGSGRQRRLLRARPRGDGRAGAVVADPLAGAGAAACLGLVAGVGVGGALVVAGVGVLLHAFSRFVLHRRPVLLPDHQRRSHLGAGQEDLQGRDHLPDDRQRHRRPAEPGALQRRPGRRVHAAARDQERQRHPRANIATIRSTDHGATWTKQETIISDFRRGIVVDPDDQAAHRTGDINPEVAVDHTSGAMYVVWQDLRFGPRSSIALSQSLDGGLTWSAPVKVNQTPPADPGEPADNDQAFTPMVQVLSDHTVAVSYYDFRNNTADGGATTPTDAFVVHCHANCSSAASWGNETRVTDASFNSRNTPVARGFFLGDYEGLGSSGSALFPFFAITAGPNQTDIYTRRVSP
jgi:hypothetical protein